MKQSEQIHVSSTCPKCGGYIDSYSLTCIGCFTIYDLNHPQNAGKEDGLKEKELDSKHL